MARYLIKKGDIKANCQMWYPVERAYIVGSIQGEEFTFPHRYVVWVGDKAYLGTCSYPTKLWSLNAHFKHWQKPTKAEVDMFEMVTGEKYLTHYLGIELT